MNRKTWGAVSIVALILLILSAFSNNPDLPASPRSAESISIDWGLAMERVTFYAKDTMSSILGETTSKYYVPVAIIAVLLIAYGISKVHSKRRNHRSIAVRLISQKLSEIHPSNLGQWARRTGVGRDGVRLLLSKPAWQELPE